MSWLKYVAPLIGMQEIVCDRCYGRKHNSRGEWCFLCDGTGTRVVKR